MKTLVTLTAVIALMLVVRSSTAGEIAHDSRGCLARETGRDCASDHVVRRGSGAGYGLCDVQERQHRNQSSGGNETGLPHGGSQGVGPPMHLLQ